MNKLLLVAMILTAAFAASANADVVVRVQVFQESADADPKAVPAGEPAMTIETQATAGGRFLSRSRVGKQTIELKGHLKRGENGSDRVSVTFTEQSPAGQSQLSTSLMLKLDQPVAMGKSGDRKVVLTLVNAAEDRG